MNETARVTPWKQSRWQLAVFLTCAMITQSCQSGGGPAIVKAGTATQPLQAAAPPPSPPSPAPAAAPAPAAVPPTQQAAGGSAPVTQASWSPKALEELLAPIALYPDQLLAQVLAASVNSQEVLDGGNWLLQNQELKGDALDAAAQKVGFGPAMRALLYFP